MLDAGSDSTHASSRLRTVFHASPECSILGIRLARLVTVSRRK